MLLFAAGGVLVAVAAVFAALGFRGREQVVGIDLGTTFSVVAIRSKDSISVVPDYLTGKYLLPSAVTFLSNGTVLVGADAVAMRGEYPEHTIFNSKRFIGRTWDEVVKDAQAHPYRVESNVSLPGDAGPPVVGFAIPTHKEGLRRWVSPIDVGAEIVAHMRRSVAEFVGYPISRAVMCVPAKFSEKETRATQRAFEMAGLKVTRVVEEPTAAAVAYNLHKNTGVRYVLVYDIGGGTMDTSLLYMNGRSISVMGLAGDDHLGGSDFDLRLRDVMIRKSAEAEPEPTPTQHNDRGSPPPPPPQYWCSKIGLHILAERVKIELSSKSTVEVACLHDDTSVRRFSVTKEDFEEASKDLFDRCVSPLKKLLEDHMMTVDDVNDLVLVGGASRMPKLRQLLQDFLGASKRLHSDIDPDVTIAYGAANILD